MNTYPHSRNKREGTYDRVQNKRNKGKGKISYENSIRTIRNKGKGKISYEDSICCEARTGCDLERV